ncbi:hypothetical protein [Pectinatus cerevisiiphilus]|uniref:Uncharacterized protein n=1 Tax=Pectinatus cerevisiiphilus TaxID=86956 RepID=A0A4R3KBP8_9FIRM|nr:hypothetical protein [Pectinatus cerevisiiphilus]TCS80430.1 hypothetical protein EDC37_10432 [Pectinatus cerevisiiphilus]
MQVVMNFILEGIEYMVYETHGYVPGPAGIELLGSRRYGLGADRILLLSNVQKQTVFEVFTSDGEAAAASEKDYLILKYYLEQNVLGKDTAQDRLLDTDVVKNIYDVAGTDILSCEVHLTDNFIGRMQAADDKQSNASAMENKSA